MTISKRDKKRKGRRKSLPSPINDKMIRNAPNKRVCYNCHIQTLSAKCPKCGRITR